MGGCVGGGGGGEGGYLFYFDRLLLEFGTVSAQHAEKILRAVCVVSAPGALITFWLAKSRRKNYRELYRNIPVIKELQNFNIVLNKLSLGVLGG